MKVFLGGTCNESKWRDSLIKLLCIDYFNPVVEDWTVDCQEEELRQRQLCDFCVYVITPKMSGVYSIAEVIDDTNKKPNKTIFCYLVKDENLQFSIGQIKSLESVGKMVQKNGSYFCKSLNEVADLLNRGLLKCQKV